MFPCSDKAMVEKVFNIFNEVRAPKIPERLETEEAEVILIISFSFKIVDFSLILIRFK